MIKEGYLKKFFKSDYSQGSGRSNSRGRDDARNSGSIKGKNLSKNEVNKFVCRTLNTIVGEFDGE